MTCSVDCDWLWHCSDETVHYKSNETVIFCRFRCVTTSAIAVFYKLSFTFIINSRHTALSNHCIQLIPSFVKQQLSVTNWSWLSNTAWLQNFAVVAACRSAINLNLLQTVFSRSMAPICGT